MYQSIIDEISRTRNKDFELLKSVLDDNRDQISLLRSLVERTKTMHMQSDKAFQDLFKKLSAILENRCVNHLKQQIKL